MSDTFKLNNKYEVNENYSDPQVFIIGQEKAIPEITGQLLIAGENNAQSINFEMDRYYDGIDISDKQINILYSAPQGYADICHPINVKKGEEKIRFTWVVPAHAVMGAGELIFSVEFVGDDYVLKTLSCILEIEDGMLGHELVSPPEDKEWYLEMQNMWDRLKATAESEEERENAENLRKEAENKRVIESEAALKKATEAVSKSQQVIADCEKAAEEAKNFESKIDDIREDLGNLNKEKLDSDVVYEVGDDGEVVSSTKMMDISGNGEIAKISADSVYKDNIIHLPNIAEKTVNGLTYSVKDGIISLNGTATMYTLIDLGVNLSMMDGLSAIGYKIFILDGTHPSGMSIILGISFGGYAQTLTNTVQEKKSSSLITFNNKNIGISINNNTAVNIKFGVVVIPINDIPSTFNVGKKYAGYMLNQLICTNNMWAFGTNISKIKLAQYYRFRKNKLYGKSLFVAGDSVAFGFGSGGKSYADIIAEKNKMSMKKVAVSGTTFAKRDGLTNSILEQVQTMDKMYDYVLIEGGFNDYFQKDKGVAIGTMPKNMNSSRDDKTTYGALDSICLWLKQKYPSSKLLFIVPHKIMTSTGVLDDGFYPYLQAIRNVCEKYSISYADIALKGGCTPFYQEFRDTYFSGDGIHPNLDGYESFYVPRIEAEMETL